jgi:hypothetical protein
VLEIVFEVLRGVRLKYGPAPGTNENPGNKFPGTLVGPGSISAPGKQGPRSM